MRVRWIEIMLVLCLTVLSWSAPAQAATNLKGADSPNQVTTELEAEVLQVIRNHPEVVWESLQVYQQQQWEQQKQAQELLSQELKASPDRIIGESPATDSVDGKIVLLEFSDFQCPFCSQAHKTLKQFMATHQDRVALVYKNLPLSIHPEAMPAAKAAWAANQQGKFWQYHDTLFNQQDKLGEQLYLDIARNLNLDLERFNRDRHSQAAETAIEKDIEMAQRAEIGGTPFLAINGKAFAGAVPLSELEKAL
ncbi:DsbA family protein [Dapis sp. BLCC M172]|uniref:DsbA family protein n=1 Tax=Dapis sp. BLCC M172 TaxID=2975281 RepID=UPI003CF1C056